MAQITGETVRRMARDIFDYEIAEADAEAMAHTAGAMLTMARHLAQLDPLLADAAEREYKMQKEYADPPFYPESLYNSLGESCLDASRRSVLEVSETRQMRVGDSSTTQSST